MKNNQNKQNQNAKNCSKNCGKGCGSGCGNGKENKSRQNGGNENE